MKRRRNRSWKYTSLWQLPLELVQAKKLESNVSPDYGLSNLNDRVSSFEVKDKQKENKQTHNQFGWQSIASSILATPEEQNVSEFFIIAAFFHLTTSLQITFRRCDRGSDSISSANYCNIQARRISQNSQGTTAAKNSWFKQIES